MKKAAVLTVLFLTLFFLQTNSLSSGNDKFKHFGVSLLFGTAGESVFHYTTRWKDFSLIGWGTAVGTLPGLVKEILDSMEENNHFSSLDLAADFAGALCGAVLGNFFNNQIQVHFETGRNNRRFVVSVQYTF